MFDSKIGICTFFLFMCTQGHGIKRDMKLGYNYNLVNNWDLFLLHFINKKKVHTHTHTKRRNLLILIRSGRIGLTIAKKKKKNL